MRLSAQATSFSLRAHDFVRLYIRLNVEHTCIESSSLIMLALGLGYYPLRVSNDVLQARVAGFLEHSGQPLSRLWLPKAQPPRFTPPRCCQNIAKPLISATAQESQTLQVGLHVTFVYNSAKRSQPKPMPFQQPSE